MQVTRVALDWLTQCLMQRRRVLGNRITYVGLDVHKDEIVVTLAEDGLRDEFRDYGRIANTPSALQRLVHKLDHEGAKLRFCYEARSCGYGIQLQLSASGHDCVVVARSLIPKRPNDWIKTGRIQSGKATPGRRFDRGVGSRSGMRRCATWCGYAFTRCRASCRAASSSRASWCAGVALPAAGLDEAASPLARGAQVPAHGASCRAGGLH